MQDTIAQIVDPEAEAMAVAVVVAVEEWRKVTKAVQSLKKGVFPLVFLFQRLLVD